MRPFVEGAVDQPIPVAMLGSVLANLQVRRVDASTLEMRSDGGWNRVLLERLTRSAQRPWHVGETVSMARYEVEIAEITEDGRPLLVRFVFDASLNDPTFRWFAYDGLRLVEWEPPSVGERRDLPRLTLTDVVEHF
jgi:hypothetical protein